MPFAQMTLNDLTTTGAGATGRADRLEAALTILALALAVVGLYLYRGYAGDDTFIHLTYARNLVDGHGFSFNPGEPSYGSTSPLWTLLVAGGGRLLGGNVYLAAKLLGGAATLLCVIAFRAVARVATSSPIVSGLAAVTFAIDPWLWKWGGSGMETPLALLAALVAVRMHLRRRTEGGVPASAFILGFGTLLRPELVGLFLVMLFDRVALARRPAGEALFALFGYLVPILPWLLYAYATFGDVVPATVHAKSGHMGYVEVVTRTVKILGSSYSPALGAIAIAAVVGVRRGSRALLMATKTRFVLWAWALGLPIAYLVTQSYVASRYLLPSTAFIVLLAFFGISMAWTTRRARATACVIVLLLTGISSAVVQAAVIYPRTRFTRGVDDRLIEVAEWIRASTPEHALVAVHEVGAIGYFSGRRVLDTAGLVTPGALPYVATYRIPDLIEDHDAEYYVSSGDPRIDHQVMDAFGDRLTLLFERPVQRGGSSALFAEPLRVGVYRLEAAGEQ